MAIPLELFRFRIARNIQAQEIRRNAIDLSGLSSVLSAPVTRPGRGAGHNPIDPNSFDHWLTDLSTNLALRSDRISPVELEKLLPDDWKEQVAADEWSTLKLDLAGTLADAFTGAASHRHPEWTGTVEALARLLRLHALVETLSNDSKVAAEARTLGSARDVEVAAGHALVILPNPYFALCPNKPRFVREPGFTDFYVVRDEWNRYEAGELARVINVLPGEVFDTRIKHTEETETTISTTVDSKTSEQTENSQTLSTSLSQTSTTDASLNIGVQGQVQVSGQYGPAHVDVSAGAQIQASLSHSETKAFVTATENVQRSVKEVAKTIVTAQTRRTLATDSTLEHHQLSNNNATVTVGLYRWLSEIHRVQLWRYPNRLVLEFEIPEPGVWLRWAMLNAPTTFFNQDPGPFSLAGVNRDLSPLDLNADTIAQLASQWKIQGLPTPPPGTMILSAKVTSDPSQNRDPDIASDNSLIVPDGYVATDFDAEVYGVQPANAPAGTMGYITVTVGGSSNSQITRQSGGSTVASGAVSGQVGSVNTGSVPIAVYSGGVQGFTCVVNVTSSLMPETYRQWQQAAFDQVVQAYQNLQRAHQQEVTSAAQQPGSIAGLIGPPELNRARATAELRRLVIEEMMGSRFNGENAIELGTAKEPNVKLDTAQSIAPTVQFFEQAFEWENLVYICYPYYWARRAQWPTNAIAATADPEFDRFLNCGSARVVVPARPGFENLVNYFRYTGCIWEGQQPPAPNDPGYLSVAQEIQSLQTGATDGTPVGSSWEISLPTMLLWAGDDPTTLPTNPTPSIAAPTP
jgi:hypothetical protein